MVVCSWGKWARSVLHWHWPVFGDASPHHPWGSELSLWEAIVSWIEVECWTQSDTSTLLRLQIYLGSTSQDHRICNGIAKEINFQCKKSNMHMHCSKEKWNCDQNLNFFWTSALDKMFKNCLTFWEWTKILLNWNTACSIFFKKAFKLVWISCKLLLGEFIVQEEACW